ncbi:MAG TPA: TolC family protein [Verrucomicrobiae bacterium]|nr:TolC family protein [Verrucomicrobiae bacterium]
MGRLSAAFVGAVLLLSGLSAWCEDKTSQQIRSITLEECIRTALLQNRMLQIERLTPAVTESLLSGSYSYYDPTLTLSAGKEHLTDAGGLDPTDFSRDVVYSADSDTADTLLTGFLPGGLSYTLSGSYAYSEGTRNGLNFASYSLQTGVAISQPLLRDFWIDQGRMTIQVNKRNLKISELGVHYVASDVINRVQLAFYELAYAMGNLGVQEDLLAARQQLLAGIRRRIEMGTLTVLDERLAEAQVARVEAELTLARNAVQLAENELRSWMGDAWTNSVNVRLRPGQSLLVLPERLDLRECWERGLNNRADLAQLRQEVEKAGIDLRFRRNQLFPSLNLVAGYGRKGASTDQVLPPQTPSASFPAARDQIENGDSPNDMLGVVFSVPLTLSAERANYRASKHLKAQWELRVKQLEEQVMREISDAVHTVQSRFERVERTRRTRELSEAALEAEEQKLTGGKSTLFFVLQLQSDLATSRTAEIRAKADYNQAVSQLRFAEATLLEQRQLDIEVK